MAFHVPRATQALCDLFTNVGRARSAVNNLLLRVDPNDDRNADRLTLLPLAVLTAVLCATASMVVRWKYQPMQDLGHEVALAAIVADYGHPHSLYTALYTSFDATAANSLMAEVAGHLGRITGVTTAVRICLLFYVLGVPLAGLYALRVFGRSAWGAVLVASLCFGPMYVAGFANLLFAAPFAVVLLPLFYRLLDAPTWKRTLGVAILLSLLFLAHAHMFLWTGALLFLMAIGYLVHQVSRPGAPLRERARAIRIRAVRAMSAVLPSLLLFAHWYRRTFEIRRADEHTVTATVGWHHGFGASFRTIKEQMDRLHECFRLFQDPIATDLENAVYLFFTIAICVALKNMHRYKQPPILELAFGITAASYFVLPTDLSGHEILAQRQIPIAMWFLPAIVSPLPARVSRAGRFLAVALIMLVTGRMLYAWHDNLVAFETKEVAGLDWVMKAAPPRMRIHYVKSDTSSAYFGAWRVFLHIEKFYMGDSFGSGTDTTGVASTSPVHFRDGVNYHRIMNKSPNWPKNMEIWQNFDLVLIRRWHPTPDQKAAAERHGKLLRKRGDWELWRSKEATPIEAAP